MIVAHHFVVNSGLLSQEGPLLNGLIDAKSVYLLLFGMWGKIGINCFLMITGYFMCTQRITIKKFLKLLLQFYFYKFVLFLIFFFAGYETLNMHRIIQLLSPFGELTYGFVECFIVFYLTIPFLSVLVQNITKRQHELLLCLSLGCYTILGSIPGFNIYFNYITWFIIVFFMASYIRLHPSSVFERKQLWCLLTVCSMVLAMLSVLFMLLRNSSAIFFFVMDCNKILAVLVAVCSFLWFKNMNIPQNKVINAMGAATFGVLLIHANSDAMRTWLWKDTVDVVGHYSLPIGQLVLFSISVVLAIFVICNLIDQLRIATLEKWFFNWYDRVLSTKADKLINRLTN